VVAFAGFFRLDGARCASLSLEHALDDGVNVLGGSGGGGANPPPADRLAHVVVSDAGPPTDGECLYLAAGNERVDLADPDTEPCGYGVAGPELGMMAVRRSCAHALDGRHWCALSRHGNASAGGV
jgi:hypothetical protein